MAVDFYKNRALVGTYTATILFIGLCLLWLPWLGETPFYSKGEPREAVVAMSMLQSGDWILPVSCGGEIPFKPPFCAWLTAIFAMLLNGGVVNEYVSRLPSALAAIAMIMMGYAWVRKTHGHRFAFIMGIVTATSFEVFRAAEASRVDMVLTAAMVGALYLIFDMNSRKGLENIGRYAAAAVLLTIATLTKGPIGSLLPCAIGGVYLLLRRENFFSALFSMLGLVILSAIVPALWYYAAWKTGGDAFLNLAFEENIGRLTGSMSYESHENPFWYNFVTILSGMLPWTLIALFALFKFKTVKGVYNSAPLKPEGLMSIVAAVGVILFYCIPASKRSVYLLPAYPFMAYGITVLITSLSGMWPVKCFGRLMGVIGIVAPVTVGVAAFMPDGYIPGFSFDGVLSWVLLCIPVAVSLAWWRSKRRSEAALPIVWAILLFYNGAVLPAVFANPLRTPQTVANFERMKASTDNIYTIGVPNKNGLAYWPNFYLDNRMRHISTASEANSLPRGTTLWITNAADTNALSSDWKITEFGRNPDTRHTAWTARK